MREIKAYHCDYCVKYYKHKSSAQRHEKKCFYNPNNKACLSCEDFITDYADEDYSIKNYYCGNGKEVYQHHCTRWASKKIKERGHETDTV